MTDKTILIRGGTAIVSDGAGHSYLDGGRGSLLFRVR